MSDSLRTDGSGAIDIGTDAARDEKIEQLLLAGLDHYFASRFEQAVNVWTRALFLDRNHPRARAYIERARSALAERQRESEELLQQGLVAFNRGESEEAKRLLLAAMNRGAPADEAHGLLDRLNREPALGAPGSPIVEEERLLALPVLQPRGGSRSAVRRSSRALVWTMVGSLAVAAAVGVYWLVVRDGLVSAVLPPETPGSTAGVPSQRDSLPPVPRRGEIAVGRARTLSAGGRLHEALAVLDSVRPTDPEKAEADRLRAEIQRKLFAQVTSPRPSPGRRQVDGRQP